jgi:hypothetical protein
LLMDPIAGVKDEDEPKLFSPVRAIISVGASAYIEPHECHRQPKNEENEGIKRTLI